MYKVKSFFILYLLILGLLSQEVNIQQHIREIVKELQSGDKERQLTALSSVVHLGDNVSSVFPAMLQTLHSKDIDLQVAALKVFILLEKASASLTYEFVKLLQHDNNNIIELTMKLLTVLQPESIAELRKNLNHPEPKVRGRILFILAEIGTRAETAVPEIISLLNDSVWQVRYYAVVALGKINAQHAKVIPQILAKYHDSHDTVKKGAIEASAYINPPSELFVQQLTSIYQTSSNELKASILKTLGQIKIETPKTFEVIKQGLAQQELRLVSLQTLLSMESENHNLLEIIAPFLKDEDARVRLATVRVFILMRSSAPMYLDKLLPVLVDGNYEVKIQAIDLIGTMGDKAEKAIPALLSAIEDPNASVQTSAAIALGKIGAPAIPILVETLVKQKELRSSVSYSLGRIGKKSVPWLLPLLGKSDPEVEFYVLEAFAQMKEDARDAIPVLIKKLKETNSPQVAHVLSEIGVYAVDDLLKLCSETNKKIAKTAADIIINIGAGAIPQLLNALEKEDLQLQLHVLYILGKITEDVSATVPSLVKLYLQSESVDIKTNIIIVIGNSKSATQNTISILIEALQSQQYILKKQAVIAVGNIGEKARETIPLLVEILKNGDNELKKISAQSLVFIGPESIPFLLSALKKADNITKAYIIIALGNLREDASSAVPALVEILRQEDADTQIKGNVIYALANIKSYSQLTMMALQEQLGGENLYLKQMTIVAMGQLGDWGSVYIPQMLYEAAKHQGEMVPLTIDAIANMGEESVPYIVPFLKNKDEIHKEIIVKALAKMGVSAQKAVPSLLLELENASSSVRKQIITAIHKIGDPTGISIPSLSVFLRHEDWEIRELAAVTIGNIGKNAEIAIPVLLPLLDDPSWAVRGAVTDALVNIGGSATIFGLQKALQKPYEEMQIHALIALKKLGSKAKEAAPEVFAILKNKELSVRVRANAIYTLGEIASDNTLLHQTLVEQLHDKNWYIQEAASFVLKKLQKQ